MRWLVWVSTAVLCVVVWLGVGRAGPAAAGLPQQKVAAAQQAYSASLAEMKAGMGTAETVYRWSRRWLESGLEAGGKPDKLRRAHLDRMTALEELVAQRVQQGMAKTSDGAAATYYRLEAQIEAGAAK